MFPSGAAACPPLFRGRNRRAAHSLEEINLPLLAHDDVLEKMLESLGSAFVARLGYHLAQSLENVGFGLNQGVDCRLGGIRRVPLRLTTEASPPRATSFSVSSLTSSSSALANSQSLAATACASSPLILAENSVYWRGGRTCSFSASTRRVVTSSTFILSLIDSVLSSGLSSGGPSTACSS
jgi:hypothetical protein